MAMRRPPLLAAALFVALPMCLHADGGFIPVIHGIAESADQRAVIIDRGDSETIVLQTAYEGDAADFAWVIPLPARVTRADIGTADPAMFTTLEELTAPRMLRVAGVGGVRACGCAGSGGAHVEDGVTVWETLRVDGYDVAVLSAEDSANLSGWLSTHGYALPDGNEATLAHYVTQGWYFVALKIAPTPRRNTGGVDGAPGGYTGEELRPITLSFATDQLVFPMRISRLSTRERVEVLLYVLSDHRAAGENYPTAEVDAPASYAGGDFRGAYEGWLEGTLTAAGGRALAVEWAGWVGGWSLSGPAFAELELPDEGCYLTRLRTRLRPAQMEEDIVLAAAASDERFEVVLDDGYAQARGSAALAMLALTVPPGFLLRSRRTRRLSLAGVLCALLIVLL